MHKSVSRQSSKVRELWAGAVRASFRRHGDREITAHAPGFFKTVASEYGAGDGYFGDRDRPAEACLRAHCRFLLLYAIEKLPQPLHGDYRNGTIG